MDQQDLSKSSDLKSKTFNAIKEGKVKDAIQEGMQDVQERFGEMEFDWKSVLGLATVIGAVSFLIASRPFKRLGRGNKSFFSKVGLPGVGKAIGRAKGGAHSHAHSHSHTSHKTHHAGRRRSRKSASEEARS